MKRVLTPEQRAEAIAGMAGAFKAVGKYVSILNISIQKIMHSDFLFPPSS